MVSPLLSSSSRLLLLLMLKLLIVQQIQQHHLVVLGNNQNNENNNDNKVLVNGNNNNIGRPETKGKKQKRQLDDGGGDTTTYYYDYEYDGYAYDEYGDDDDDGYYLDDDDDFDDAIYSLIGDVTTHVNETCGIDLNAVIQSAVYYFMDDDYYEGSASTGGILDAIIGIANEQNTRTCNIMEMGQMALAVNNFNTCIDGMGSSIANFIDILQGFSAGSNDAGAGDTTINNNNILASDELQQCIYTIIAEQNLTSTVAAGAGQAASSAQQVGQQPFQMPECLGQILMNTDDTMNASASTPDSIYNDFNMPYLDGLFRELFTQPDTMCGCIDALHDETPDCTVAINGQEYVGGMIKSITCLLQQVCSFRDIACKNELQVLDQCLPDLIVPDEEVTAEAISLMSLTTTGTIDGYPDCASIKETCGGNIIGQDDDDDDNDFMMETPEGKPATGMNRTAGGPGNRTAAGGGNRTAAGGGNRTAAGGGRQGGGQGTGRQGGGGDGDRQGGGGDGGRQRDGGGGRGGGGGGGGGEGRIRSRLLDEDGYDDDAYFDDDDDFVEEIMSVIDSTSILMNLPHGLFSSTNNGMPDSCSRIASDDNGRYAERNVLERYNQYRSMCGSSRSSSGYDGYRGDNNNNETSTNTTTDSVSEEQPEGSEEVTTTSDISNENNNTVDNDEEGGGESNDERAVSSNSTDASSSSSSGSIFVGGFISTSSTMTTMIVTGAISIIVGQSVL